MIGSADSRATQLNRSNNDGMRDVTGPEEAAEDGFEPRNQPALSTRKVVALTVLFSLMVALSIALAIVGWRGSVALDAAPTCPPLNTTTQTCVSGPVPAEVVGVRRLSGGVRGLPEYYIDVRAADARDGDVTAVEVPGAGKLYDSVGPGTAVSAYYFRERIIRLELPGVATERSTDHPRQVMYAGIAFAGLFLPLLAMGPLSRLRMHTTRVIPVPARYISRPLGGGRRVAIPSRKQQLAAFLLIALLFTNFLVLYAVMRSMVSTGSQLLVLYLASAVAASTIAGACVAGSVWRMRRRHAREDYL